LKIKIEIEVDTSHPEDKDILEELIELLEKYKGNP